MATYPWRPMLALLAGVLSCTVLGKISTYNHLNYIYRDTTICRTIPGLTPNQRSQCLRNPRLTEIAMEGLQDAIVECHYQFRSNRWNCSSLSLKAKNSYTSAIYRKGLKETAFAHAISSAGVALSIARACFNHRIRCCPTPVIAKNATHEKAWKWYGCEHYLFGVKFARRFLAGSRSMDIDADVNRHNSKVGWKTVVEAVGQKCKCHGLSGSCTLKTCWKPVPELRKVGNALKQKYNSAVEVQQKNVIVKKRRSWAPLRKKKGSLASELIFYQKFPNFCEREPVLDFLGTSGRTCNSTSRNFDGCDILCCGRGYNSVKRESLKQKCKFIWCCNVKCDIYKDNEYISVCK